jgi:hypothetical protein
MVPQRISNSVVIWKLHRSGMSHTSGAFWSALTAGPYRLSERFALSSALRRSSTDITCAVGSLVGGPAERVGHDRAGRQRDQTGAEEGGGDDGGVATTGKFWQPPTAPVRLTRLLPRHRCPPHVVATPA